MTNRAQALTVSSNTATIQNRWYKDNDSDVRRLLVAQVMAKILTIFVLLCVSGFASNSALFRRNQADARTSRSKHRKRKPNLKAQAKRKELANLPTYIACGCGCCGGVKPQVKCLYRSKGDDLQRIIDEDKKTAANTSLCARVGCATPRKYKYCD